MEQGLCYIISISASKYSFVVVYGIAKQLRDLGDRFLFIG